MHRTDLGNDWHAYHNGDFSGDVTIVGNGSQVVLPFRAVANLVAEKVRREKISKLEQQSPATMLGLERV